MTTTLSRIKHDVARRAVAETFEAIEQDVRELRSAQLYDLSTLTREQAEAALAEIEALAAYAREHVANLPAEVDEHVASEAAE